MGPVLLVDGYNVLHAGVLTGRGRAGWWRPAAQQLLLDRVALVDAASYREIWVVFDRRPADGAPDPVRHPDPRLRVAYTPSADKWIIGQVHRLAHHRPVTVVTADRLLRQRVREAHGALLSPRQFLAGCGCP